MVAEVRVEYVSRLVRDSPIQECDKIKSVATKNENKVISAMY